MFFFVYKIGHEDDNRNYPNPIFSWICFFGDVLILSNIGLIHQEDHKIWGINM